MRSQGITFIKIHEHICQKGYTGTVASLRVFMQKERTHARAIASEKSEPVEYIPRKFMCQLIYQKLENVRGLTKEQFEAAIKKYPQLGKLYTALKEFYRIVFSRKSEELDQWINHTLALKLDYPVCDYNARW